ncbi:hypothetical protein Zmor_008399 [Zophobas morio]|uniref:Glucose dehydrogenase [acceptor] n=2 Tax=Zophobas morio TaxID=2755281 RepID=A0AA38J295_9CUCU|nr:hypothetical protein Zmor_008399 [Zophobas morio]
MLVTLSFSKVSKEKICEFQAGVDALMKESQNHTFEEKNFDTNLHVEADPKHYDFVIVGAGAAGSVIANRLSAKHYKVLLLEAGGPETPYTQIPKLAHLLHNTDYNWGYLTTPQKNTCRGMIDNICAIAAGKALGGSTAINDMYCTRGNREDYNQWAAMGNHGWSYDDLLPYFKKLEDAFVKPFDPVYRHRGGPFHIEHPRYWTEITNGSLSAGKELGFDNIDFNAKNQLGMGRTQLSTKRGKRHSTAQAYLVPARKRSNLVIKPFSHVTKLLIDSESKEATGVEFFAKGKLYAAKAQKEVILSAGAISTAQILKLSGIGPREELDKFDIPVVAELNVGRRFIDHVAFIGLSLFYKNTTLGKEDETDEIIEYLQKGKGPLSVPGSETVAYFKTDASNHRKRYPDIELFFYSEKPSPTANSFRFKPEILESFKSLANKKILQIGVMLVHPQSIGTVLLKDKDPFHHPLVDPNSLSDPDDEDFRTLLAGIKRGLSFAGTDVFKKMNLVVNDYKIAGCEDHEWGSDDYWKCAIKLLTISLHHVMGTARMGPKSDKDAIVDNKLRVYGVQKLRVADASVLPVTISGHTMIPSIMIGEKASDLILQKWKAKEVPQD